MATTADLNISSQKRLTGRAMGPAEEAINGIQLSLLTSFCLTSSDSILQGPLIEDVGGEGAEGWVHTVLNLQTDGPDTQHDQALKQ